MITVWHHTASLVMPDSDPSYGVFDLPLTPVTDPHNILAVDVPVHSLFLSVSGIDCDCNTSLISLLIEPRRKKMYVLKYAFNESSNQPSLKKLCIPDIQSASSEDSDQSAHSCRLIRIFAMRTCPMVRFLTLRLLSYSLFRYVISKDSKQKQVT